MSVKTKERIMELLETYPKRKREIEVLRYELAHPARTSQTEQITAMAFARDDSMGRPSGHVSDKTMYIAFNYQEQTDRLNAGILDELDCSAKTAMRPAMENTRAFGMGRWRKGSVLSAGGKNRTGGRLFAQRRA